MAWPAPAGPEGVPQTGAPEPVSSQRSSTRRRLALAAAVLLAVGCGTAGGAIAGRSARTTTSSAVSVGAASSPVFQATAATTATKADVSALIASSLPSVVSITDQMSGGQAAGTGFVVSSDGRIATNAHVVADATDITVTFHDGTTIAATVVGIDRTDDLAVIQVERTGLPTLSLGSSADLRMGDPVVAIGNALALTGGPTATEGIISALDRSINTSEGSHLSHLVQTDAAINPGNSGGPLLTLDGKVVGINSAGSQDAQNIGFAIAVDTARPILDQLEAGKTVTRAYLGVTTLAVDSSVAAKYGLEVDHGILVTTVASGTAAEAAGIKAGDVIESINATATDEPGVLGDAIKNAGAGSTVHISINRNGTDLTVDATLSSHAA